MTWLDEKYINLLSPRLDRFRITQRNPYKANFRCPYCGDSKKSKTKARGWIYVNKYGKLLFGCFNGCPGRTVPNFIKDLDPQLFKQYSMEKFSKKSIEKEESDEIDLEKEFADVPENSSTLLDDLMERVSSLPRDHFAVKYLLDRGLTEEMLERFYFIDNIEKCESLSERYRNKIHGKEPRVGLPYYDRKGRFQGITFRAIEDHPIKYLDLKISEEMPLFGIDRVNLSKRVYVLEGPIDSLFLPNAVAVGSSDLSRAYAHLPTCELTFIFDNQPRNKELHASMRKAMKMGFSIFIWPKKFESGDLNDLVKSGECTLEELPELINSNTYKGLKLQHKFNEWKRCI